MTRQLQPNTYTVCESTEQCKELFEWAKSNGVRTSGSLPYIDGDLYLCAEVSLHGVSFLMTLNQEDVGSTFIPLTEFISRLKGEWVNNESTDAKNETVEAETWDIDEHPFIPPNPVNAYKLSCCKPERMEELLDKEAKLEAQARAINEALEEISIKGQIAKTIYMETKDEDVCYMEQGAERAYMKSFEILTNKLK